MISAVIDARTGRPFEHGEALLACFAAAAATCGRFDPETGQMRLDARGFDRYRARRDAVTLRQMVQDSGRKDALTSSVGAFPRDLEFIYPEVLGEARRPMNMASLVQVDSRVPLGARTHTVRRRIGSGDTAVFRGGTEIPVVRGSYIEEQFGVIHLVTSVMVDYFELLSDSFAGRASFADDTRDAIRFLEERANLIGFNGYAAAKIYGLLNYPHLVKTVSAVSMTPTAIAAAPATVRAELNRLANYAIETSGGTFRPNRMATSIRLRNALMQTQNSTASDRSVGQVWLDGQPDIKSIEPAHELQGVGPAGATQDAIAFYDDSIQSTANVVIQGPTPLPVHAISALQNQIVYVMTIGGVVMRNSGNNLLGYATAGS